MSFYKDSVVLSKEYASNGMSAAGFSGSVAHGNFATTGASSASSLGAASQIAQDLLQFANAGGASTGFSAPGSLGLASGASALSGTTANFGGSSANFGGSSVSFGSSTSGSVGANAVGAVASASSAFLSQIEAAILSSSNAPININETEEITVLGNKGLWANKTEVVNWKGTIPIEQYAINEDANPEVINKKVTQQLEYIQELAIRYLRPPTPPTPGEIIIKQEGNTVAAPAPPLVIRQVPARPATPEPLVIREAPPQAPVAVGRKLITIGGKRIPPPPRKVVIERLAPLPSKPQSVIIERWLPYQSAKRRVIFQKAAAADPVAVKPRNVIVQWDAPQVAIKKEIKYLGVIKANPTDYVAQYGAILKSSRDLPQFVLDIPTPDGIVLAANSKLNGLYELEGDVAALQLIDLDREGLGEYRTHLQSLNLSTGSGATLSGAGTTSFGGAASSSYGGSASFGASSGVSSALADEIFRSLDINSNGSLSIQEAQKAIFRLNSKLGRAYSEADVNAFFRSLDVNSDGQLDLQEFRRAFLRLF